MNSGRGLDIIVAEKIMNITVISEPFCGRSPQHAPIIIPVDKSTGMPIMAYSIDIAAAWTIVEKFGFVIGPQWSGGAHSKRIGWAVYSDWLDAHDDTYEDPGSERALATAETMPHAVCLAALKVVESAPNKTGYLGDINGPGCDPDVP